jgi:spore germination protein GerM
VKSTRIFVWLAIVALAIVAVWYFLIRPNVEQSANASLTVYYTKLDGTTLGSWNVSVRSSQSGESDADRQHYLVEYAALQAVAGPPPDISAVRFPPGVRVLSVAVNGSTAIVDLSSDVRSSQGGSFQENGEFKGLVYTLTGISTINAVQITIEGRTVSTLPGGHLELDAPLRRSDW